MTMIEVQIADITTLAKNFPNVYIDLSGWSPKRESLPRVPAATPLHNTLQCSPPGHRRGFDCRSCMRYSMTPPAMLLPCSNCR